jgi:hypothetical protein
MSRISRNNGPVHSAYNPSFSACFFSQNSIFLSQQISQQCFSAGLSAQLDGSNMSVQRYSIQVPNQVKQESKLGRHLQLRKYPDNFRNYLEDFRKHLDDFRNYPEDFRKHPKDFRIYPDDFKKYPGEFRKYRDDFQNVPG